METPHGGMASLAHSSPVSR